MRSALASFRSEGRLGTAALTLALLVLLLRLLVPAGWMPASQGNTAVLSLCSGLALPGPDDGGSDDPAGPGPCAFSLIGPVLDPAPPPLPAPVALSVLPALLLALPDQHRGTARAVRIPPSQGP